MVEEAVEIKHVPGAPATVDALEALEVGFRALGAKAPTGIEIANMLRDSVIPGYAEDGGYAVRSYNERVATVDPAKQPPPPPELPPPHIEPHSG